MTVGTSDPTHPRDIGNGHRGWWGGGQVDDPLTVWSWACNPLTAALANEETVARAPHVFPARGRVSDWSGLIARVALNNMLVLFTGDINHVAAYTAADHGHTPGKGVVGGRQLIRSNRRNCGGCRRTAIHHPILFDRDSSVRAQQRLPFNIVSHDYYTVIGG